MVIGLTGGIASGKTAASDAFGRLGVDIIDTDLIAREVVAPGSEGLAAVVGAFGDDILDAKRHLDRARLRRLVFSDHQRRRELEGILHPLIRTRVEERLASSEAVYAMLVVPLLVESPQLQAACDRILLIDVDEATQLRRLQARDGVDEAQARQVLTAQSTRAQRQAIADDIIINDGSLEQLEAKVARQHERYLAMVADAR